jgi:hypothetical protein
MESNSYDCVIVGTGPNGIAAATAAVKKFRKVLILDGGRKLEVNKQNVIERLSNTPVNLWLSSDKKIYQNLLQNDQRLKSHIGSKLQFGSDFPYENRKEFIIGSTKVNNELKAYPSLSTGGLSNVWGSICLPIPTRDQENWTLKISEDSFKEMSKILKISANLDDLAENFHLNGVSNPALLLNSLGRILLHKYDKHKNSAVFSNFLFGQTRVAVENLFDGTSSGCKYCGLCATGCPEGSIWNSANELIKLMRFSNVEYFNSYTVDRFIESNNKVIVYTNNKEVKFSTNYLIITAGALMSSAIILNSIDHQNEIILNDTQQTIIPCFMIRRQLIDDPGFVLSQVLGYKFDQVGKVDNFIQILGYNSDMINRVRTLFPLSRFVHKRIIEYVLSHIAVVMIFQKPSVSGTISIKKHDETISIKPVIDNKKSLFDLSSWRLIKKALKKLGMFPLKPLSQIVGIGESYHFGSGKFTNGASVTDERGLIKGFQSVYNLDCLSLESIVPGPLTFTQMAKSYKIIEELRN